MGAHRGPFITQDAVDGRIPGVSVGLDWTRVQMRYHFTVMRSRHRLRRRHRLLWVGLVVFCLLFQQLAMAAYVCTLPSAPATQDVAMNDCAAMGMGSSNHAAAQHPVDPRCTEHCASHVPATPDAKVPAVPPLLWPSDFAAVAKVVVHAPAWTHLPDPHLYPPESPPSLRFCSLLI